MEHVGHPAVGRRLPGGLEPEDRDVGGARIVDGRAVGGSQVWVDAFCVDGSAAGEGQHLGARVVLLVGEQRHRALLRAGPRGTERRVADDLAGGVGVDEGVVEEAELELEAEQPADRLVEAGFGHPTGVDEPDDDIGAVLAAELVDAGVEELDEPVLGAQVLDSPRLRRSQRADLAEPTGLAVVDLVVDQTPVGADDAVEAELLAEDARDDRSVEAEPDLLEVGADSACRSTA